MLEVLTNPRCSKCRQLLAYLDARAVEYQVRNYLQEPLTLSELERLAEKLGLPPGEWMRERAGETREEQLQAIAKRPELLQRPIVILGERAVLARTLEPLQRLGL